MRWWSWMLTAAMCWRWYRRHPFDPNDFTGGIAQDKWQKIQDLTAEKIAQRMKSTRPVPFLKTVVALAALEKLLESGGNLPRGCESGKIRTRV